jgi:hypothetical protein
MEFSYDNDITICALDEAESAEWAAGDDARAYMEARIQQELIARGIENAVSICASDGSELDFLEPA